MNIRRTYARSVGEEITNALLPKAIKMILKCKLLQNNQVSVNPPAMTDGEVRAALFQMNQTIMSQANRKVVPRENPHASTMASRLRDFTRMNPPMYFRSKVDDFTQDFLDEV